MTATQRLIPLNAKAEWQATLGDIEHAFGHTWESCHAMALTTGLPTFLYVWDNASGRAVCPFAERTFSGYTDIVTPYGFSGFAGAGDTSGMPADWLELVLRREYVCGYIGMNPLLRDTPVFDPADVYEYNDLHVLDLTRSEQALFESLSRNRQRHVKAYTLGRPAIVTDHARNAAFLLEHYAAFLRRLGANAACRFSDATLRSILELPNTLLIGAGAGGRLQAVWLFTHTPAVAESFLTVSLPEGRQHAAALTWHGALELKRRGIRLLNLGGGVQRGDSVARFKERFGAAVAPLTALKQVYRPDIYAELCVTTGADPQDRTGYFPPYHRLGLHAAAAGDAST